MDLKDATSCGRCAGTRGCRRGKGPQSHWALIHKPASPVCWDWLGCSIASGLSKWGGALFTHCPGRVQSFSLSSPRCRWLWACWRSRKCVFPTRWRCQCDSLCSPFDDRLSCVSWIPPDPLVELYHWLQGEGTGGLVTSRWLIVREPREPALSYCSHWGPHFILLMCGQHRLKRNSERRKGIRLQLSENEMLVLWWRQNQRSWWR